MAAVLTVNREDHGARCAGYIQGVAAITGGLRVEEVEEDGGSISFIRSRIKE